MGFLGGLLSTVAGGVMNMFGANQQNQMNQQNSADRYQVASQDMQKAGLNPAMMFGSGGAAQMPGTQNPMAGVAQGLSQSVSSALAAKTSEKTIDVLTQQLANMKASELNTVANTKVAQSTIPVNSARADYTKAAAMNEFDRNAAVHSYNSEARSRAQVARNAAMTAVNQMSGIPGTARKVLDIGSFAGDKIGDMVEPIGKVLGVANSAKSLFRTGKSMRVRKRGIDGDADAVNDNVSDDVWNSFLNSGAMP